MFSYLIIAAFFSYLVWKVFKSIGKVGRKSETIGNVPGLSVCDNLFQCAVQWNGYLTKLTRICNEWQFKPFQSSAIAKNGIVVSDLKDIKEVMSRQTLLKEHLVSPVLFPQPAREAPSTKLQTRLREREPIISAAFDDMNPYMEEINDVIDIFLKKCFEIEATGEVFDVQGLIHKCSIDIVHEHATGLKSWTLNGEEEDTHRRLNRIFKITWNRIFEPMSHFKWLWILSPMYWWQLWNMYKLRKRLNRAFIGRTILLEMVPREAARAKKPFVDNYLSSLQSSYNYITIFSELSNVFEESLMFLYKGHAIISSVASFTIYILSQHLEIQQKITEEQHTIIGTDLTKRLCFTDLTAMVFLESVILETLRLYPAFPVLSTYSNSPIELTGMRILDETQILMCLLAAGQNEQYFPKPHTFSPHRKFDNEGLLNVLQEVSFGAGVRGLMMKKYSMCVLKTIVSKIVQNFEILAPVESSEKYNSSHIPVLGMKFGLYSENGIPIRLRRKINLV